MKRSMLGTIACMLILGGILLASQKDAEAVTVEPVVFDLNYVLNWSQDPPTADIKDTPLIDVFGVASFGTITLSENATDNTKVDIVVDLVGNGIHKIQGVRSVYHYR